MQFLTELTSACLTEGGTKHFCYVAELFETRPSWKDMASFKPVTASLEQSVRKLAARDMCPFKQMGIYVDTRGAWLLATGKK